MFDKNTTEIVSHFSGTNAIRLVESRSTVWFQTWQSLSSNLRQPATRGKKKKKDQATKNRRLKDLALANRWLLHKRELLYRLLVWTLRSIKGSKIEITQDLEIWKIENSTDKKIWGLGKFEGWKVESWNTEDWKFESWKSQIPFL